MAECRAGQRFMQDYINQCKAHVDYIIVPRWKEELSEQIDTLCSTSKKANSKGLHVSKWEPFEQQNK